MTNHKKKDVDVFKGRTKEWDRNQWQGRSRSQVEGNYKILDWTLAGLGIALFAWAIYTTVISLFG